MLEKCWVSSLLLCVTPQKSTTQVSVAYRVLEVFPRGLRVLITYHSPDVPPPVTYALWRSRDIEVAEKVVNTHNPASFSINVPLKSTPDLLTCTCQAAATWSMHVASAKLQMYWELWASEFVGTGDGARGVQGREDKGSSWG